MELLYINYVINDKQLDEEVFRFVVNYIISENITVHSNVGFTFKMFKNIDSLTDDEILKYLEMYLLIINKNKSFSVSEELKKIDDLKAKMKNYKQLKHRNQLPSGHFKYLQALKASYIHYRNNFKGFLNDYLKFLGVFQYIDLYDENIIKASYSEINRDCESNDNELGELLYNNLSTLQNMLLLDDLSILEKFNTHPEVNKEQKEKFTDFFKLYDIPLVTLPCSSNLQLNELVVLRQMFLSDFTALFTKVQCFRNEINIIDTKKAITKKVNEFKSEIKLDLQKLQNEIDNNLYFLKIKNSDSDYTNVTIYVGILLDLMIFNYFSGRELISYEKFSELDYRLTNNKKENFYDLFVYYKMDLDMTKYKMKE